MREIGEVPGGAQEAALARVVAIHSLAYVLGVGLGAAPQGLKRMPMALGPTAKGLSPMMARTLLAMAGRVIRGPVISSRRSRQVVFRTGSVFAPKGLHAG
jgi:hypothetical protein